MLEVEVTDIASLRDDDLRELVARLSEATLRKMRLPRSSVTWGGNQDAADGGLDVRVSLPAETIINGFVPRPETGIQVKKPGMAVGAIKAEMRPGGQLRPSIARLCEDAGAYVLVSAGASVSDTALTERVRAMRQAVSDHPGGTALMVDFYDARRLTTWLRDHPGLVPWVRGRAGRWIQGWQSHGDWSRGGSGSLLRDGHARLRTANGSNGNGLDLVSGLAHVRDALGPGCSIRLVGLSGVGKTRFAQALFDDAIGDGALDPALALYADAGQGSDPIPLAMATHLVHSRTPAIIVVDNCAPALHGDLTRLCRMEGSTVGILTIEYDIRADRPEGSDVYHLEAASPELVAALVRHRVPSISEVDAETIGRVSGGNARVGLALAHTLRADESLAGLTDEDLFLRLFEQRHGFDKGLLSAAEACALVYSFEVEAKTEGGPLQEMAALAELAAGQIQVAQIAQVRCRRWPR